jgi:hypothetical protein
VNFIERHFNELAMLVFLLLLVSAHAFMMHYARPPEMIRWIEGLISSVATALVAMLAGKNIGK